MNGWASSVGLSLTMLAGVPPAGTVKFKQYYEGLPDLEASPPFARHSKTQAVALRSLLGLAGKAPSTCPAHGAAPSSEGNEICGPAADRLRSAVQGMAPGLTATGWTGLWTADLDRDGEPELIAGYQVPDRQGEDRYFAFFVLRWTGDDYRIASASWFLEGSIHAIRRFDAGSGEAKVVVRLLSCTMCEPFVYLVIADFGDSADGSVFELSYAPEALNDSESWSANVEYELPGMGHSIEADVETRVLEGAGPANPQLMQYYHVKDGGPDEWWSFRCAGLRCAPEVLKGKPSEAFLTLWRRAKRI